VQVRSQPIRWITGVHVAKLSIAGLLAADAAQQAAADPLRPLVGLLLRPLAVWTAFTSLVSFAVSWRADSQADLRLVGLLALLATVLEAAELVRSFTHLDLGEAPSVLPIILTRWLLAALLLLDACTYLLARSLRTVVGWRHRVSRAGAASSSSLLLLRASLRLDLLLLLPALLGATVANPNPDPNPNPSPSPNPNPNPNPNPIPIPNPIP
jgi:hypothetical protein